MSKEQEALERLAMPDELHKKECERLGISLTEDYEVIKKAITELKAIKETKPSEALECLKNNSELFDKIALENSTTYKNETFAEAFVFKANTLNIEQALLKAQEQEKVLEIIKPHLRLVGNCLQARAPFVSESDDNWVFVKEITDEEEFDLLKRWSEK